MNPSVYRSAVVGVGKSINSQGQKGGGHQVGYLHARAYQGNPRAALVAGVDINKENLQTFLQAHRLSDEAGFHSLETMLATVRPDIVSLCTYVGLRADMIETCADAGVRGLICEKPFVHSIPALKRVAAAVERTGVKIVIAHIRRYLPVFIKVRELMDRGSIGRAVHAYAGIEGWDLSEWGSHWLDMFRFLNHDQSVLHVFGQGRVRQLRGYGHAMEDHALAHLEFVNGFRCTIDGGHAMSSLPADEKHPPATMTIAGDRGIIQIRKWLSEISLINDQGEQIIAVENESEGNTWPPFLADMVSWLDGGEEPDLGFGNTRKSAELNLSVYLSMIRGDRVDFPVTDTIDEWPVETLARRSALV